MKVRPQETTFRSARWNPRWGDLWPVLAWMGVGGLLQLARLLGPAASTALPWLNP
ncbi:hypothetical protein GF359_04900, partial [candidate division WOR-3 bacterium]|nr:hypothetical protein [candidate division WOR-3 bacterium]MBD3364533.1 hypothetical protein [candidate division WOR-3 bacterium]